VTERCAVRCGDVVM